MIVAHTDPPQLAIDDVSVTYPGGVRALDGVSLTIGPGVFGLLGPNGAGKSTLMRTIATLQRPDSGTIRFGTLDLVRDPAGGRRVLGYLPQEFGFYPNLTSSELLDHFARLEGYRDAGHRRAVVATMLDRVNLADVRDRPVGGFSGGMTQRLGIAVALLGDPRLLIVDEPTAGLDPVERRHFHDLLADAAEHVVILLSTHIVEDVRELCTSIAVLAGGRVLVTGDPRTLVEPARGRVWQAFVAPGDRAAFAARHTVLSMRRDAGTPIARVWSEERPGDAFTAVSPDLEDVYVHAVHALQGVGAPGAASPDRSSGAE